MSDGKFFHTTKRGELHELKEELHSANKDRKKEAVKKVIAAMTVGKDVSSLFADVVNCMQTTNIELKKLVYLYVINYARAQPELAILAVNTFRKDALDANPLIRALAVRTMGCIRLEQITEYLVEPLRRCCKDPDPYVRKTAAICIAKLYDITPTLVEDQGFLDILQDLLADSSPMVVANAVAALTEISEVSGKNLMRQILNANDSNISRLLAALNECTEWGQVFILDSLAFYNPTNSKDAESILDRVVARLSHANPAVVLSAIKVVMKLLDQVTNTEVVKSMERKLCPPLVTLLSCEAEVQYVALRNILLIVQKRPSILCGDVRIFFCKYNDPVYVKMEKLNIIVKLVSPSNVDQILMELREYASEIDVDFVRKAVKQIGRCAIKISSAAERCLNVLLDLIETKVNYVVQEAIVVIKDIFRKYPNRYESVISALCENLQTLDEPDAKASMIWIIGEYAERIQNADDLLASFLLAFHDETTPVQLQILTATVKLFLKNPLNTQDMVTKVLKMSTEESENPDLRDRAYIYWRLLSSNPEATKHVVLGEKPQIADDSTDLEPLILDRLIEHIGSLASVFHKVPEAFVTRLKTAQSMEESEDSDEDSDGGNVEDIQHQIENQKYESSSDASGSSESESGSSTDSEDDSGEDAPKAEPSREKAVELKRLLGSTQAGSKGQMGLQISGALHRSSRGIQLKLAVENKSASSLSGWAIQFNKNPFGLAPADPLTLGELSPGQSANVKLPVNPNQLVSPNPPAHPLAIQVAIKCSLDVFYFGLPFELDLVLTQKGAVDKEKFRTEWQALGESMQSSTMVMGEKALKSSSVTKALGASNCFLVADRVSDSFDALYFSAVTENGVILLFDISLQKNGPGVKISVRTKSPSLGPILQSMICKLFGLKPKA